jgi:hypothetical protein
MAIFAIALAQAAFSLAIDVLVAQCLHHQVETIALDRYFWGD